MASSTKSTRLRTFRDLLIAGFTHNPLQKLLSLAVAIGIWAWVQSEQVIEKRTRARVAYSWPTDLVHIETVPRNLVVTVKGPHGLVRTIDRSKLKVNVDLSPARAGTIAVDFTEGSVTGLPPGLEVTEISPPGIDITLDRKLNRLVKVTPSVMGDPAEGWRLVNTKVDPPTLQISGAQQTLRSITQVETEVIDISGWSSDKTVEVDIQIKENNFTLVQEQKLNVHVDLEPLLAERTFNKVPVLVRTKGWSTKVETATVTFSGPLTDLTNLAADQVTLVVQPPDPEADAPISIFHESDSPNFEIVHGGPKERILVKLVQPAELVLVRP